MVLDCSPADFLTIFSQIFAPRSFDIAVYKGRLARCSVARSAKREVKTNVKAYANEVARVLKPEGEVARIKNSDTSSRQSTLTRDLCKCSKALNMHNGVVID